MVIKKKVLVLFGAAFLALAALANAPAATQVQRETSLLAAVNAARAAHGLKPLVNDAALTRAARGHSATMLRTKVFAHGDFGARIRAVGATGPFFGENLGWGVGTRASAREIVRMWLRSPGHRANLLRPGFRRVGLGAPAGPFAGYSRAVVVTANFAGR
ncbi:MAG TPA: CAP domain-containing protein [Gaiellaceae bacterium]|nr:CAP domain-containing protein [Gaiellaceae bacterium]